MYCAEKDYFILQISYVGEGVFFFFFGKKIED